jgi:hypothetical protein
MLLAATSGISPLGRLRTELYKPLLKEEKMKNEGIPNEIDKYILKQPQEVQ